MTVNFTFEELTAIKTAEQANRADTIIFFENSLPYYGENEKEEYEFVKNLINKLKNTSDMQFDGLDLTNAIDTSEDKM